ncbi:MAG: Hsp20/alpha crystallin family protein [Chloroflexi bacterium]|nr:Hsp20/alpha crystallin family protein [Chloroflexota bacterium]OJV91781.1 MAG: hypothetical protein BGO39_17990 [Chloroflexi bacterium 54-19]
MLPGLPNPALPIRMYQTESHLVVATPMPGLEPEDILITIASTWLTLQGDSRGPRQHGLDLVVTEWTIGPYYREVELPYPVNGPLSNATYGNGVLVVSMPRLNPGELPEPVAVQYRLEANRSAQGEHVGHFGKEMVPTTTSDHRHKVGEAILKPPHRPVAEET